MGGLQDGSALQPQPRSTPASSQPAAAMTDPKPGTSTNPNKKKYKQRQRTARMAQVKQLLAQHSGRTPVFVAPNVAAARSSAPATAAGPAAASAQVPAAEAAQAPAAEPDPAAARLIVVHQTAEQGPLPETESRTVPPSKRRHRINQERKRRRQAREAPEPQAQTAGTTLHATASVAPGACKLLTNSQHRIEEQKRKQAQQDAQAAAAAAAPFQPPACLATVREPDNAIQDQKRQKIAAAATVREPDDAIQDQKRRKIGAAATVQMADPTVVSFLSTERAMGRSLLR